MRVLYGEGVDVIAADDYAEWRSGQQCDPQAIIPWGWDLRLKQSLLKQGAPEQLMPSDEQLARIRELQHRKTVMSLQPQAWCVYSADEVRTLLAECGRLVLKAPWSGSGRGLRWVDGVLSDHDEAWIAKTVASQRCVMAEKRQEVAADFALEFHLSAGNATLVGLSLFKTQSGVYRCNELLWDDEIRQHLQLPQSVENSIRHWLRLYVAPYYTGPVGVDLIKNSDGDFCVSEMNLRHTMGLVAHRMLQLHPDLHNTLWSPNLSL